MSKFDEEIKNLSPQEKRAILRGLKGKKTQQKFKHSFGSKHFRFGYFSDSHIGHKEFSLELWDKMVKVFKREKIDRVFCPGDITEGMSGRDGHIYELTHIGASAQIEYASELINQIQAEVLGISGNHDNWFQIKGNMGLSVGEEIAQRCPNFTFLGDWEADVEIAKGIWLKLYHGNDGSA